jgi:hypothetical protein
MAPTTLPRFGIALAGAGLLAATAIGGASAASATQTSPTTTTTTASVATATPSKTAAPAAPTPGSNTAKATTTAKSTKSKKITSSSVTNNMIHGVNLTVKNTTKDQIGVTFNYDGGQGGQATWTWLSPGQSTSVYNATDSGPDIFNSYVYFPSTGKQLKFESLLAAWTGDTSVTFDGTKYEVERGQSKSDRKQGHAITVSRGNNDITLPLTDWIDGMPTVAPDMVLDFTL